MRNVDDMVAQFARAAAAAKAGSSRFTDRLTDLGGFGSNPGALRARIYVPSQVADDAALVVVLHGCTQTAAGYDHGAGWSKLADRYGIVLLFPEQLRANNPNCCFNWFSPADARRGHGEAESIRQMIERVVATQPIDRSRIFVTGLSAGGAMTAVMLATHPEIFAGGAIIAGLPYGSASSVPEALERMRGQGGPEAAELTAAVRRASSHEGPWPTLSIWHGSSDTTVVPVNGDAILNQWRSLHGVGSRPDLVETVVGHARRVWRDASGREVIEAYSITGMAHGTPLATAGDEGYGAAGPFMLEANISSTLHIARFWGLARQPVDRPDVTMDVANDASPAAKLPVLASLRGERVYARDSAPPSATGVQEVIEKALRAAGLMK